MTALIAVRPPLALVHPSAIPGLTDAELDTLDDLVERISMRMEMSGLWRYGPMDRENSIEELYRLAAGVLVPEPHEVALMTSEHATDLNGLTLPYDITSLPRWGAQPSVGHCLADADDTGFVQDEHTKAADNYFTTRTFAELAHRRTRVTDLGHAKEVTDAWGAPMVAKLGITKLYPVERIEPGQWAQSDLSMASFTRSDSTPVLIQDEVQMTHEYRLFVIDGQVITGAGAIEEHTPLNHSEPDPFATATTISVEGVQTPTPRSEVVSELVEFGRFAATRFAEDEGMTDYVLDVGFWNGTPGVIELNGITNAGLYASDPFRVVRAMLDRERGRL